VCMRGICIVWLCVCVDILIYGCVYVWDLYCVGVRMCGFCNVGVCVCLDFVMCECV